MEIRVLESFNPDVSPFAQDLYNMGIPMGTNVLVMHGNFADEVCRYLIVIDTITGQRIQINL